MIDLAFWSEFGTLRGSSARIGQGQPLRSPSGNHCRSLLFRHPSLNFELRNALEFPSVVGNQWNVASKRVRGDPQTIRPNRWSLATKKGTNVTIKSATSFDNGIFEPCSRSRITIDGFAAVVPTANYTPVFQLTEYYLRNRTVAKGGLWFMCGSRFMIEMQVSLSSIIAISAISRTPCALQRPFILVAIANRFHKVIGWAR